MEIRGERGGSSSDLSVCPFARHGERRWAGCSGKFKESMANSAYSAVRRVEMKTEREDFSSRALLAINMKEEMLLRKKLCYIVIVPLVRAQRYVVLPCQLFIYALTTAQKNKKMLVALSYDLLYLRCVCAMDAILIAR